MHRSDPRVPDVLHDPARLAALHRTALLDSPAEESFDRITRLAACSLGARAALINLLDRDREFRMSVYDSAGHYSAGGTGPLEGSACVHVVTRGGALMVADMRAEPAFAELPSVRAGRVVAYAGVPLITSDGHALGSLCVLESTPRAWTAADEQILADLAATVVREIELRSELLRQREVEAELRRAKARLRMVFDEAVVGIALVDLTGRPVEVNPTLARLLGYSAEELRQKRFHDITHPEDLSLDGALFGELVRGERSHYQIEKRYLCKDGSVLWGRLTVSAARDEARLPQYVLAMVEDWTEHRELEALQAEVRILEGLLPICSYCKKIRNESNEWEWLESYISKRSEATFTHGCCTACMHEHFGELSP